jgi:hypothetical protein
MAPRRSYVHGPMVRERRFVGGGCQRRAIEEIREDSASKFQLFAYLLAQLENGERESGDEGEERELKCIPSLKSENSERKWDQSHGFQENEDEEGDEEFLQLRFTSCKRRKSQ